MLNVDKIRSKNKWCTIYALHDFYLQHFSILQINPPEIKNSGVFSKDQFELKLAVEHLNFFFFF